MKNSLVIILSCLFLTGCGFSIFKAQEKNKISVQTIPSNKELVRKKTIQNNQTTKTRTVQAKCYSDLRNIPGKFSSKNIREICSQVEVLDKCHSEKSVPIFHYERIGKKSGTKILALGTIHGDEGPAGNVIRAWMERLMRINPRNTWRLIPIVNPDGLALKIRTNANGVDLNRNFPTKNWETEAAKYWKRMKKHWRRFPGNSPGSEKETKCIVKHINEFKPDLIIAIHTPLGVLDFDGPTFDFPKYKLLPWRRLGHFPGSLGRYMWRDHGIPVLTVELKGSGLISDISSLDQLQDISGLLSIMTNIHINSKKKDVKKL